LKTDDPVLRDGPGRPPYQPTDADRAKVKALAAYGTPQEQIARVFDIHVQTLRNYYRDELDLGVIEANAQVAKTLFNQGVKDGNTAALIWWTKSRMGWKEKQGLNVSGGLNLNVVTGIDRAPDDPDGNP
jgi:hypothetical protein